VSTGISGASAAPPPSAGVYWREHPLLRCIALYGEMPRRFSVTAVLFVVVHLSLAFQQWLVGEALHDVERGAAVLRLPDGSLDTSLAWHWIWVLVGVAAARGAFQYVSGLLALDIGQRLLSILRERILAQVQALDLGFHLRHGIGEMVTRTTRDADKLRDALISFWRQVVETGLVVVATIGLLAWYDPLLASVPLLLTAVGLGILVRQTDALVALDRATGAAYDAVNQDLAEGVNGVRVIKAFALEANRIERFEALVGTFVLQARAALGFAATRIPVPQVVVALGHVWILLYGSHLVAEGSLNFGELVSALMILNTLVFRIEGVGRVMQVFADARSSAMRIWELLDARPAIRPGTRHLPSAPLGIRLQKVGVDAPGGGTAVLRDCSLRVDAGEVVALVGITGSGKSTLAALFPRLVDAESGEVEVGSDDVGWHDVRQLDLRSLRGGVHVVPQETFLFSDSIATNLRMAKPDASEQDLWSALQLAAAADMVAALPQGLETALGDRGVTLSGGQRQRLSLARAVLADPAVLILDDATSALDAITERTILDNIRAWRGHRGQAVTLLLIASKLSTILLADRVLMLRDGHIADQGRHADLAARNADYRDLVGVEDGTA